MCIGDHANNTFWAYLLWQGLLHLHELIGGENSELYEVYEGELDGGASRSKQPQKSLTVCCHEGYGHIVQ